MSHVFIIGAGVSGCTAAYNLAECGVNVTLVEKEHTIGGRVRSYGCKAVEKCQNCGVCLTGGLWKKVAEHQKIRVLTDATVNDVSGNPGDFIVTVSSIDNPRHCAPPPSVEVGNPSSNSQLSTSNSQLLTSNSQLSTLNSQLLTSNSQLPPSCQQVFDNVTAIVVCTGFESQSSGLSSHLHISGTDGLMTGSELEEQMLGRTGKELFANAPNSVAFVQCLGSRDQNEGGLYCSRVCCSYSTRAAKVIRSYYPDCEIVFYYMELQSVEHGDYFKGLRELGIEFVKCRPIKITGGKPVIVEYDDPKTGITNREFDLVVLSDGIHEGADNERLAEVCKLGQDEDGFLRSVGTDCGVYVAGCVRAPMKIDEAYADAIAVAGKVLESINI